MRMRKGGSSPSKPIPVPLLTMRPAQEEEEDEPERQMQIVTTTPFRFRLPDDWSVEERPRSNSPSHPGRVDKYYTDPDTGLKFRSLVAVQRYLTEGRIYTPTKKLKPGSESNMQTTPHTFFRSTSSFILPDDWEIEEKPRSNSNYSGVVDKYYIEPGTRQRFRSLRAVERYLAEANEDAPLKALIPANKPTPSHGSGTEKKFRSLKIVSKHPPNSTEYNTTLNATKLNSCSMTSKHSSPLKKNISGENSRPSELNIGSPPTKVNWVLAGPGGNMWNPFMDKSMISESVKQKWSETFISSIYDGIINAPRL